MHEFPHHYPVTASASAAGSVEVSSPGLATLDTAPPAEFGGPGDVWSPETLLVASVANCMILTFRAIARASRLEWDSLRCDVDGELDKIDRVTQFTGFEIRAHLEVPAGTDPARANRLLHKAEQSCLITNSLKADSHLVAEVTVAESG
ncbi:MAG: OsmC family protein [Woeseiaceae bacterium]|nr:OsmC family protein [Woeseiaceae bacterium]